MGTSDPTRHDGRSEALESATLGVSTRSGTIRIASRGMAEPLKNSFGPDVPSRIGAMIAAVEPDFDRTSFVAACLVGFESLELTDRARQIADVLAQHLQGAGALSTIVEALGPEITASELTGMDGFLYLPFVFFVAEHGLDRFEEAMHAQYELTKRFTAEFSIRAFIDRYPERTFQQLQKWATDPNVHVRRLVSEGSRPRLPWAPRLRALQADPSPVIELLEILKDDPEEYVRRSVANNLNDISKDHPDRAIEVARRWWTDATEERRRLIRHGLRSLIKQGNAEALSVLGYGPDSPIQVAAVRMPAVATIGGSVKIEVDLENPGDTQAHALMDLVVHFVKANGSRSPKVFKGAEVTLGAGAATTVSKSISVKQHTTRRHYPGRHDVEVQVNGKTVPGGTFELTA